MALRFGVFLLFVSLALGAIPIGIVADPCEQFLTCSDCVTDDKITTCGWCPNDGGLCISRTRGAGAPTSGECPGTTDPGDPSAPMFWIDPQSAITASSDGPVIKPDDVSVFLRPFHPLDVPIKVIPAIIPLDIVFVEDLSGSMTDDVATLRALADRLITDIRTKLVPDSAFGIVGFIEKPINNAGRTDNCGNACRSFTPPVPCASMGCANYPFEVWMKVTGDRAAFKNRLDTIANNGNIDWPEDAADGMAYACTPACKAEVGWRDTARHMMIISTDASFHIFGKGGYNGLFRYWREPTSCGRNSVEACNRYPNNPGTYLDYPSVGQLRQLMLRNNIVPIFAATNEDANNYVTQSMVQTWGFGVQSWLTSDSSNIYSIIETAYNEISSKLFMERVTDDLVWLKSIVPPSSSPYTGVKIGEEKIFTVTLESDVKCATTDIELLVFGFGNVVIHATSCYTCNCPVSLFPCTPGCKGLCDCGKCVCPPGFIGVDCECEVAAVCSPPCAGGTCECGKCKCLDGLSGALCDCPTKDCPTAIPGTVCSGHGTCDCAVCTCDATWGPDPIKCPAPCPPEENTCECGSSGCPLGADGTPCGANGQCICGVCVCDEPTRFTVGDDGTCDCQVAPCPRGCSGPDKGLCKCGVCECLSPWDGCPVGTVTTTTPPPPACVPGVANPTVAAGLGCTCSTEPCPVGNVSLCADPTTCVCSGHGECACGACECEPGWRLKEDCSCSQESCPSDNGAECSGHGTCVCGKCECKEGWGTESCGCSTIPCDPFCLAKNLTCDCGKCICPPDLGGPTCEDCLNCIIDNCGPHPDCESCIADTVNECAWCADTNLCVGALANCGKKYTAAEGCPEEPLLSEDQAVALGFGLLALVLCIGAIIIAILKAIQKARELREFQQWEEDQKKSKWDNNANPLFAKQEKEGTNQLYQGR